jgi:NADP-dependent 3-hydroxy acid dehydrogenase YdfG
MATNNVILVSGGSFGIGKAICDHFVDRGFHVINADVVPPSDINGAYYIYCDVRKGESIDQLFKEVMKNHGLPNFLLLNAGIGIHEKLEEGDPEKWQNVFEVNTMGALRLIRAFLPQMITRTTGDVLFISSVASENPYAYGGVYSASKAALTSIAKTLQKEVQGVIRVMIIYPGVVSSQFFEKMSESELSVSRIGVGAISPQQIADLVYYLHSLPAEIYVPELTVLPINQSISF